MLNLLVNATDVIFEKIAFQTIMVSANSVKAGLNLPLCCYSRKLLKFLL